MTDFVAVDGEADNQGRYIIMCDSTGRVLHEPRGIGTLQAFDWLLELQKKRRVVVCFGLNYDMNMWLKDVNRRELERLVAEGETHCFNYKYRVSWMSTKQVQIWNRPDQRYVRICEVFGFFQCSFLKALEDWGVDVPAADLEEIERMKLKRGTFSHAERERVIGYCLRECHWLVELMNKLEAACVGANCRPNNWIGAGSIASKILNMNGVTQHHAYDTDIATQSVVDNFILGAYFGGRVEMLTQGIVGDCKTLDINSAYPAAAQYLPSLQGATVKRVKQYDPTIEQAIWQVRWKDQNRNRIAPFPVRRADRSICYPTSGEGTYHAIEVKAAFEAGYRVDVLRGVQLVSDGSSTPFDFIPDLYSHRARLKAEGNPAQKAIKLGINSVYGKLAQGYPERPKFQSYWWAGYITAATRAKMLGVAVASRGVCMISTDGIFATAPARHIRCSARLGAWDADTFGDLFCAQPGVYAGLRDGVWRYKSRGFFVREVDFAELRRTYVNGQSNHDGAVYRYKSRRFIGLRVALHRKDFSVWRTWPEDIRAISLRIDKKEVRELRSTYGCYTELHPMQGPLVSLPYEPKVSLYDSGATHPDDVEEALMGEEQPHYQTLGTQE